MNTNSTPAYEGCEILERNADYLFNVARMRIQGREARTTSAELFHIAELAEEAGFMDEAAFYFEGAELTEKAGR